MELQIEKLLETYQRQADKQSPREIAFQNQYYELAKAILDAPKLHPKGLHRQIQDELQIARLPFYTPRKILGGNSGLNTPEKRVEWVKRVRSTGENLGRFVQESVGEDYKTLYERLNRVVSEEKRAPQMQPKAILFVFASTLSDDVSYKPVLQQVTRIANFDQGESLLGELIDLVAVERGLIQRRVAQDHARVRIARTLVHLQSLGESEVSESEQEVEDLREAVEIAQQGLRSLQTDIDRIGTEARQEASVTFFQEMNSIKHSHFLDRFFMADMKLQQFQKQGAEIPQEIEVISVLIPIFNQFLRTYNIQPKAVVGETITLTLKESDNYEYIGSDFENMDEHKTVEVLSPGWICEGRLIIRPKVKEIG